MSDFGYWSWPLKVVGSYEQVRREIADMEIDFALKKKQVVWRGALKTNTHRKELINVAKGKQWADIKAIEWSGNRLKSGSDVAKALSMPEHCQYQFVLQTEGQWLQALNPPYISNYIYTDIYITRPQLLGTWKIPS